MIHSLPKREEGQGLVEYALILVLVAIVVIAVLLLLGPAINEAFCKVTNVLQTGSCDTGAITVTSGPTVTDLGGTYRVSMTVLLSDPVNNVTVTIGAASATQNCTPSCSFTVNGVTTASGSYTINAGALGSKSGSY